MNKILASLFVVSLVLTACGVVLPTQAPTAPTATAQATEMPAPTSAVCPAYNDKGWPLTEVTSTGTCIYTSLETVIPTAQPTAKPCTVINDYQLLDLPEVSVENGGWLHVETFINGQPEYETVLPSGRYTIDQAKTNGGHVWEYAPECTIDEVLTQVTAHTARRLELKANNGGYVHYQEYIDSGLFTVVVMTGDPNVPLALP